MSSYDYLDFFKDDVKTEISQIRAQSYMNKHTFHKLLSLAHTLFAKGYTNIVYEFEDIISIKCQYDIIPQHTHLFQMSNFLDFEILYVNYK